VCIINAPTSYVPGSANALTIRVTSAPARAIKVVVTDGTLSGFSEDSKAPGRCRYVNDRISQASFSLAPPSAGSGSITVYALCGNQEGMFVANPFIIGETASPTANPTTTSPSLNPTISPSLNPITQGPSKSPQTGSPTTSDPTRMPTFTRAPSTLTPTEVVEINSAGTQNVCFPGNAFVTFATGELKQLQDVTPGDVVLAASYDGTLVNASLVFLPHRRGNTVKATFIVLQTKGGHVLEVTGSHLVRVSPQENEKKHGCDDLIPARNVKVGMCLRRIEKCEIVVSISIKTREGVYTMITSHPDGIIVVNGFQVSSFGVNHVLANNYYHVHRALHRYMPTSWSKFFLNSEVIRNLNNAIAISALAVKDVLNSIIGNL